MTEACLPGPFAHLAPYVKDWALSNERDRFNKLHGTGIDGLRAFYAAMLPEMEAVLEFLNGYPLDKMPTEVQTLFKLAMTFAETAHPLDLGWKDVDFPSAYPWDKFQFRTVSLER
jgi:hypothetical protein